jgi:hypothetical protein
MKAMRHRHESQPDQALIDAGQNARLDAGKYARFCIADSPVRRAAVGLGRWCRRRPQPLLSTASSTPRPPCFIPSRLLRRDNTHSEPDRLAHSRRAAPIGINGCQAALPTNETGIQIIRIGTSRTVPATWRDLRQIGGYRLSTGAQRNPRSVTGARWPRAPADSVHANSRADGSCARAQNLRFWLTLSASCAFIAADQCVPPHRVVTLTKRPSL